MSEVQAVVDHRQKTVNRLCSFQLLLQGIPLIITSSSSEGLLISIAHEQPPLLSEDNLRRCALFTSSKRELRVKTFKFKVKVRLRLMVSDAQVCHIFVFNFLNARKVRVSFGVTHVPVMVKAREMH